jgi:ribosomal protein L7/L12
MTSPPQQIIVQCPACGHCYEDWYRPSINRWIETFSDEFIDQATTATCPRCNYKAALGAWISDSPEQLTVQIRQARFKPKDSSPLFWITVNYIDPTCRLSVMKVIRSVTNLALSEVKYLVNHLPQTFGEDRDREKVENLKKMLEEAGAQVSLHYF